MRGMTGDSLERLIGITNSIILPIYLSDLNLMNIIDMAINCLIVEGREIPLEIIVVDDGSPKQDGVCFLEKKYHSVARFIRLKRRSGLIKAINEGASQAQGNFLTYCHSDCFVTKGTLKFVNSLFDNDDVGLVVSNLWYPNNTLQQSGGWISHDFKLSWSRYLSKKPKDVHWGDFWTVRASFFKRADFLDEKYGFGYWECVDLATTVRMQGFRVVTSPESKVIHFQGKTFRALYSDSERNILFETNREIFVKKWSDKIHLICSGITEDIEHADWK